MKNVDERAKKIGMNAQSDIQFARDELVFIRFLDYQKSKSDCSRPSTTPPRPQNHSRKVG